MTLISVHDKITSTRLSHISTQSNSSPWDHRYPIKHVFNLEHHYPKKPLKSFDDLFSNKYERRTFVKIHLIFHHLLQIS